MVRLHKKTLKSIRNVASKTFDGYCKINTFSKTETDFGLSDTIQLNITTIPCRLQPLRAREINETNLMHDYNRYWLFLPHNTVIKNSDQVFIYSKADVLLGTFEVQQVMSDRTGDSLEIKVLVAERQYE